MLFGSSSKYFATFANQYWDIQESVAEFTKSPLYTISAGELGADPAEMEKSLSRILRLCTVWDAVLLLDEADVFLEERSLHDLGRNALVSIFLRLLEYCKSKFPVELSKVVAKLL